MDVPADLCPNHTALWVGWRDMSGVNENFKAHNAARIARKCRSGVDPECGSNLTKDQVAS